MWEKSCIGWGCFTPQGGSRFACFLELGWWGIDFLTLLCSKLVCFMLSNTYISCLIKKQPTMPTFSFNVEYITSFTTIIECAWINVLWLIWVLSITIFIDNKSLLVIAKSPIFYACTEHMEVHYHNAKIRISTREVTLAYVPMQDILIDIFHISFAS